MNKNNKENKTENFFQKYKTDKKYKAKIQLIGYSIFILLVIISVNISNTSTPSHGNITTFKKESNNTENKDTTNNKKSNLLQKIEDNYEYNIIASIKKQEENDETIELLYSGKSYQNNMEINKNINNIINNYYKVDSRYYTKNNDTYELVKQETVYDLIEKEYIELNDIKEYIDKSSLDHVTEYSNGKKEYVYHLKIKEIIKSYQEQEKIEINIIEENNTLIIEIDYTNLIKETSPKIKECRIKYEYKNIGSVEKFTIIEETNNQNNG